MSEAVIVGAGPNGLACAAILASRGVGVTVIEAADAVGGGARTSELTLPGLLHDYCSAVHAMVAKGVLGGVSLGRLYPGVAALEKGLVIAVTETASDADVDALESALKEAVK